MPLSSVVLMQSRRCKVGKGLFCFGLIRTVVFLNEVRMSIVCGVCGGMSVSVVSVPMVLCGWCASVSRVFWW